jgi:hypothetical protein
VRRTPCIALPTQLPASKRPLRVPSRSSGSVFGGRCVTPLSARGQAHTALQMDRPVRLLNLEDGQVGGAEWEVLLLNSFSKLGRVEYEPNSGGNSRPDLLVSGCDGIEPLLSRLLQFPMRGL